MTDTVGYKKSYVTELIAFKNRGVPFELGYRLKQKHHILP